MLCLGLAFLGLALLVVAPFLIWSDEMTRVTLSILRQVAEPLTTRDIALQLLVERALDKDDQKLLRLMIKRAGVALKLQRDKGAAQCEQGPGQYMLWKIGR